MATHAVSHSADAFFVLATAAWNRHSIGSNDGSIIATIITSHIPTNDAPAATHVCPGIRIHTIDIVH
jgi:hypothetical protein